MAKGPDKNDVDDELVRKLARLLDETGLTEIEYSRDGWNLRVSKGTIFRDVGGDATREPGTNGAAAKKADDERVVTSPMVGMIYCSPDPDAPPFVKVGDVVEEGQTLFLIEAMKVYNSIPAPFSGKVARILISNGEPVEYGEHLLVLE
ncbi:MAG: biotin/lipoyl-containing protein [Rhodospirillales bacterium]|nr:biotin/lipoyl-containing protein [Rhodospirillales bacterium]